uniref:Uncharacterized protein n=1 Tax=Trichuris muris TaxID=70415 RepID=A0A5S6QYI0_TRIMR
MFRGFSFPTGDVVQRECSEGNLKVGTKAERLPHRLETEITQRSRMSVTEELRALRGLTDRALALKICTELQACRRVEALSRFHRSNRMAQTLLGTDEMIGFEDYLKHADVDETIEHYFMRP